MNTPTSYPVELSENRHFGFWADLRLGLKMLLIFSVIFVFAASIAAITLWGLNQVQDQYEHSLSEGIVVQALSDQFQYYTLQAGRQQQTFQLRWTSEGYDTAYANYVPSFQQNISAMRDTLKKMAPFAPEAATASTGMTQAEFEADLSSLEKYTDTYEQSFTSLVEAMKEYGDNENTGLQGDIRNVAHEMEAKVSDKPGLENLEITLLQIRRREKDYLARKQQVYVDDVHALVAQFKAQVTTSEGLQPAEQTGLRTLADQYQKAFDATVAKDEEIASLNDATIAATNAMEPVSAKIEALGEQLKTDDVGTARADSKRIFNISIITIVMNLALTVFISLWLSRQIVRPVTALKNTAEQIASGDFEVRAEVSSTDEIGALAQTFNIMTSRLGKAFEDVRRRALAVQTSAEVSRRLSAATSPQQLAVDVVEQVQAAFNYYHAHIYFVDETSGDLIMAGGTGEAGATMLARGHKVQKGRGLVGRAAETNAPVLVPDVTQAEGWLPNPLLPNTKSEAAVPISSGKQVLGVLDVQQNVAHGLNEEDITLLQSLASQVAISLQNARTYEQSQVQARVESLVNAIGQKIQRTTSVEDTLQTAIRELGSALGAARASVKIGTSTRMSETEPLKR